MRFFSVLILAFLCGVTFAQQYKVTPGPPVFKHWMVNFSERSDLLELSRLKGSEVAPKPVSNSDKVKAKIDAQRHRNKAKTKNSSYVSTRADVAPEVQDGFNGKPIGNAGIPNDNTMAISNDGTIVSAINTTVTVLDENGENPSFRSLYGITKGQLGILDRFYDPKVTYDPINDRFILVFLEGSLSSDTRIVVGFTLTNDPRGEWSFYALDGKPLGGATWSDYPIIAQNGKDLYITVNLLRDNESWQEGFVESLIWQVNKEDGYQGSDDLTQRVFSGIYYGDETVWSICPVQPALDWEKENMYFLSVRPDAEANDTVFLHEITGGSNDPNAEHRLTVLTTDVKYGVPPTAFQPLVAGKDFRLQTNDTRVLSATLHNGRIHYVQSTILAEDIRSGIYHGIISDVSSTPTIKGNIIDTADLDLAYPSIAFAGEDASDEHSMLITFSHVGEDVYPGTSVVFHNKKEGKDRLYSHIIRVKDGDSVINTFVNDTAERWGDYTDIQRKYNEPGVVWACGSYGDSRARNNVWIAKLKVENELVSVAGFVSYPNPAHNSVTVALEFDADRVVDILLIDMRGATLKKIEDESVSPGNAEFLMDVTGMEPGVYSIVVQGEDGERLYAQKIMVK